MNPLNPLHGHASGASHSASPARNALAPATTETRFGDELQKAQGIALDAGTQPAETASPGMPSVTRRPAKATSTISFDMNLNAAATAGPPPDTFAGSIEVFDSLGISHVVSANFTKTASAGAVK